MKKFALAAAISVITASAMAQNVTVYGVIDNSFQKYDTGSVTLNRVQANALTTSRLGFRGNENLGDGLRAEFQLEGTLDATSGTLGSTTANQLFNREAWVGLSGNFGAIRMGRTDVTNAQDIDTFVSQAYNFAFFPIDGTAGVEQGADQPNVVRYTSPKFGGFQGQVGFASANGNNATTDAVGDQLSYFLRYDQDRLRVMAGYQKTDGAGVAQKDFTSVGASYDFGAFSAGLAHATGDNSATADVTSKVTVASVKVPLPNQLEIIGAYSASENGSFAADNKGQGYTVGVVKKLSKRTMVYTAYSTVDNDTNAKMRTFGATTAPTAGGQDPKSYTVGISHTF